MHSDELELGSTLVPIVQLPLGEISDWESFHEVFQRVLGFPDFYGRNMDAWIDCLTSADVQDGMIASEFVASEGDVLVLELLDAKDFAERCPEQYGALIECAAFVEWRRIEVGERAILAVSAHF